jgi:hypothetical protein
MSWDEFWFGNKMDISSFADIIVRSPKLFISKTIGNIPDHFINDLSKLTGWHIGILVIAGLGSLFLNKLNRLKTTYYLFNLCFFGMLLLIFYGQRFSLFLIPFYIVTALQVFIAIEKRLIRKTSHGYLIQIALTILLVFSWMRSYSFNQKNIRSGPRELLSIAQWFDKHISETNRGSTVSARKPHIAYYLGLDFVRIPFTHSYRELIEELKKKKTDYLYIGMIEASTRRELQFLLDPGRTPPELRPVVYTRIPPSVLYQIRYE